MSAVRACALRAVLLPVTPGPPPGWTVRSPDAGDHPRVLAVLDRWWGGFGGGAGSRERALLVPRLFLEHFADTSTLVEDADGRLVAFLVGFLSPARPGTAHVHFLGVDPAVRRGGLGRWLHARFGAVASERGAREVRCVTSPGNAASIAFHTRLGFRAEPGDLLVDGVPVHADHDGPGLHRVVLARPVADHDPGRIPCPPTSP
ncbi:GNAT family N-acetyltransferase [Geodermatophilus maliterrae]|uniref:N-acetyltransferase family protein n=1 Tax=Geodermatophilus maliterrae TaxID=3162531 RepID=A0ABV3XFL9_9ACTN